MWGETRTGVASSGLGEVGRSSHEKGVGGEDERGLSRIAICRRDYL